MTYPPTEKHLTSTDGTRIYARAVGNPKNPSLVFVHGVMLSEFVFDNLFKNETLLERFYLVSYDTRAHGRSGEPQGEDGYASSLYAADFAAVLQAFDLKSPIIIGWSLGGTIACDILAHLPPSTLSGIVYASGIPHTSAVPLLTTPSSAQFAALASTTDVPAANRARVGFVDACFRDPASVPVGVRWAWVGSMLMHTPGEAGAATVRVQDPGRLFAAGSASSGTGAGAGTGTDGGDGKPLPVLLINASADALISGPAVLEVVKPHFADLQVHTIEGAGHAMFYEDEEEFVGVLKGFAERVFSAKE